MKTDSYKTVKAPSQGLYKDKGSRFISFAYPVSEQESVKPIIDGLKKKYHDARHHCYAYMIGYMRQEWRVNDDGEPSGTAGKPILGQINSAGLTNILIAVVRYFGGTLLGTSGLINAYKCAAADAINAAAVIDFFVKDYYRLTFPYESLSHVMKILKEENTGFGSQCFDMNCSMEINFRAMNRPAILEKLSRIGCMEILFIERK
ncbi:MAG: YigZ family protein [Bacteroidales bacterium]|jgi:uncharacterized YigZ family protein|nr:YigZ family protein [Bacteroidales bacterium]